MQEIKRNKSSTISFKYVISFFSYDKKYKMIYCNIQHTDE